jgi:hypothetical protein
VDVSKLNRGEILGMIAAAILVLSLFLEWYSLATSGVVRNDPGDFVCGGTSASNADTGCTGWETFPILRWLLVAAAAAPFILAWIVIRGHALSWPRGELTAIVGLIAFVLIAYNGFVDKPSESDIGVSLSFGYFIALLASLGIFVSGGYRAVESGGGAQRKPPATF